MRQTLRFLFGKRQTRLKGLAAFPGLVALLFVGHAYEDGGIEGAMLYIVLISLSGFYVVRPMTITWLPLFCAFLAYSVLVVIRPLGSGGEWVLFLLLGLVPTASRWVARPRAFQTSSILVEAP